MKRLNKVTTENYNKVTNQSPPSRQTKQQTFQRTRPGKAKYRSTGTN